METAMLCCVQRGEAEDAVAIEFNGQAEDVIGVSMNSNFLPK